MTNTPVVERLQNFGKPSVWLEFSPLAQANGSLNLGQGFPDWEPPEFIDHIAQEKITDKKFSQYARSAGHMNLCESIAQMYSPKLKRTICPKSEIVVSNGASQGIFLALMSLINPGDEVILFEPAFDIYAGAIAMAGGTSRYIPMRAPEGLKDANDFYIDMEELESNINERTKAMILNSPHNPTGKVFHKEEYEAIAAILKKYPQIKVISDEVYEHLVYDGETHIPFATIDGMFERTLSIYSAGNTFSITGWKIGWMIGPQDLIKWAAIAQQWVVFSVATPLQEVVAEAMIKAGDPYQGEASYYDWIRNQYQNKRDLLISNLSQSPLKTIKPKGSFFILADSSGLKFDSSKAHPQLLNLMAEDKISVDSETLTDPSYNACRHLSCEFGITPIPTSAFYTKSHRHLADRYIRLAFCKEDKILNQVQDKF